MSRSSSLRPPYRCRTPTGCAGLIAAYSSGRAGEAVAGGELRHIACDMDLRKAAIRRENEDALRRLTERMRFLAVRRRDFGDHKIPGADDLFIQAFLREGIACAERESKRKQFQRFSWRSPHLDIQLLHQPRILLQDSARAASASFSGVPPTAHPVAVLASASLVGWSAQRLVHLGVEPCNDLARRAEWRERRVPGLRARRPCSPPPARSAPRACWASVLHRIAQATLSSAPALCGRGRGRAEDARA